MKKSQKGTDTTVPIITHDRLFRKALGYRDVARNFFKGFLPREILARCDLRRLKKAPAAIVGKNHRDNFMDIVYICPFGTSGQRAALCLLLEHKSEQPTDVLRQLLRYMLEIWQSQQDSKLPLTRIVPIIVYHGPDDWRYRALAAEFGPPEPLLDVYLPRFEYHCVDLHALSDEDIERLAKGILGLVFKAMKHARQAHAIDALEQDLDRALALLGLPATSSRDRNLLEALIVYVIDRLNYTTEQTVTTMKEQVEVLKPREGSVLEYLVNERKRVEEEGRKIGLKEGMKKGIEKGRKEGLILTIKTMQSKGLSAEQIAGMLDVEKAWVSRVLKKG